MQIGHVQREFQTLSYVIKTRPWKLLYVVIIIITSFKWDILGQTADMMLQSF